MFGNDRFGAKLGGALTLWSALMAYSAWRGESIHPAAWRCLAEPGRWHGTELRVGGPVLSRGEGECTVLWQEVPLKIRMPDPPPVGRPIEAVGTLDREGPHLRVRSWREIPHHARFRWIEEAVSLVVLALVLANFLRHFSFRPEAVRLRER